MKKPRFPTFSFVVTFETGHDGNQLVACSINQACERFDLENDRRAFYMLMRNLRNRIRHVKLPGCAASFKGMSNLRLYERIVRF